MKASLTLILLLLVVSCSSTLWERPVVSIQADLAQGKTEFVLSQTAKTLATSNLGVLGEGALWNLATVFLQANRMTEAEALWRRSFAGEATPWKEQAGRDLFDLYSDRRDWPKAEAVAERLMGFDGGRPEFQRRLFESYYFQKKDEKAWALLKSWKPGTFTPEEERENQLFSGVLSARSGDTEEASRTLRALVFDAPTSVLQFRLESFFQEDESRYELLGVGGREAVAFQSLVYRGVAKDTLAWFKGRRFPEGLWNHRALIEGIETAFKTDTRAEAGLRILDGLRAGVTGDALYALEHARGRLYRALNWWPQARAAFQKALPLAVTPEDHKKTAWNWLNAWVNVRASGALGPFLQVYAGTDDPAYFTDVFDNWVTELVQDRQWGLLVALWRDLGHRLAAGDRATVGFILARLATHGLVDLKNAGINLSPEALLTQVIEVQPYSYEAWVARAVLGRSVAWPDQAPRTVALTDRTRERVRLWESMLGFGLAKSMASQVAASTEPLDPEFVGRAVSFLQAQGHFRPSLQVLYRQLRDPGVVLTKALAQRLYPLAFHDIVTERAEAEGLEPSLLFGLIREESSFDPEAKSWVGAHGLTQLMPATAAETAQRLRMKTYDLSLPADNIKMGARYLSTMIKSQGRIYLALMAYNAGGARIRPWKDSMGKLPEEIFVEAVPIAETRGYVKKILTSTVMTGVLHYNKSVDEMVRLIYPGFEP